MKKAIGVLAVITLINSVGLIYNLRASVGDIKIMDGLSGIVMENHKAINENREYINQDRKAIGTLYEYLQQGNAYIVPRKPKDIPVIFEF